MSDTPFIPYGRQVIEDDDIQTVCEALRSDYLTTGPKVAEFERELAGKVEAGEAVALSSGTAALHAAMFAVGVGPGDEVIVPPMTFAATANCVLYQGGIPVFADVEPDTLLIDPAAVEQKISSRTKAIIGVDYAGQPCDWDALRFLADAYGLALVADGCHALGASYQGRPVGTLADMTVFSFHPVKHITTGEGGVVVTDDVGLAERLRIFRNHGISIDHHQRAESGSWFYEMTELGYNYRITDIQCALGASQLAKLDRFLARRRELAALYDEGLQTKLGLEPLAVKPGVEHAFHLYVVKTGEGVDRKELFDSLRRQGVGVNVHYIPVHLHPYYRRELGTGAGLCPTAESAYEMILSLPLHPSMDRGVRLGDSKFPGNP